MYYIIIRFRSVNPTARQLARPTRRVLSQGQSPKQLVSYWILIYCRFRNYDVIIVYDRFRGHDNSNCSLVTMRDVKIWLYTYA